VLYACKGEDTIFTGQRLEHTLREREKEGWREREKEGWRERCRIYVENVGLRKE
jgi:hypothetical protein